jgi:hypothetical protein
VIVPVFDRAASIAATIASVAGAAGARLPGWELVVVDDGSSDGSAARARDAAEAAGLGARARVVAQANAGPGPARNRGAALARGKYLAFVDSDDLWLPWTLEVALGLVAAEEPALVFLQGADVAAPARPPAAARAELAVERHARFLEAVARTPSIRFASCNVVVRADVFAALGGFTGKVRCSEDTDLFLRADRAGPCLLVRAPLMMVHAVGGDSLTGDAPCVARGLGFMLAAERAGRYPGGRGSDPLRTALLAGSAVYAARVAFAAGHPGLAYRLALRHAGLILRGGKSRWLPRLLLTPLLALVRPRSYPFRRRPARAGAHSAR